MTYSQPPAPGRHHLGPPQGESQGIPQQPSGHRDPAWWPAQAEGEQPQYRQEHYQQEHHQQEQYQQEQYQQGQPPPERPAWQQPSGAQAYPGWGEPQPPAQQAHQQGQQGWQQPGPGWQESRAAPVRGDIPPGWQPPYQGAAEFQREYVPPPVWEATPPVDQFEPGPSDGEPITSTMRGQIVDRMIRINTSHALQAADRLGTKLAVGPHCLALFSIDTVPGRYQRLSTATRLILDGEDADVLPDLLRDLTSRAREKVSEAHARGERWEPRAPMTGLVLRSEEYTESTPYIGLGISTLDTPEVPWTQARQNITGADGLHLRGQGLIYLHDGTAMHLLRRAQMASGQHEITSSRRVDSQYANRRDEHLIERAAHQGDLTWELMRGLHEVLATA